MGAYGLRRYEAGHGDRVQGSIAAGPADLTDGGYRSVRAVSVPSAGSSRSPEAKPRSRRRWLPLVAAVVVGLVALWLASDSVRERVAHLGTLVGWSLDDKQADAADEVGGDGSAPARSSGPGASGALQTPRVKPGRDGGAGPGAGPDAPQSVGDAPKPADGAPPSGGSPGGGAGPQPGDQPPPPATGGSGGPSVSVGADVTLGSGGAGVEVSAGAGNTGLDADLDVQAGNGSAGVGIDVAGSTPATGPVGIDVGVGTGDGLDVNAGVEVGPIEIGL